MRPLSLQEEFMLRVTKTKTTLLDPTSQHQQLHASQHMTTMDWKFGLGLGKDVRGTRLKPLP